MGWGRGRMGLKEGAHRRKRKGVVGLEGRRKRRGKVVWVVCLGGGGLVGLMV